MKQLQNPIATTLSEYRAENRPFIKLHRLVDVYETLIKYLAVVAIQNFYAANLDNDFPDVDRQIRERIIRPSLGQWVGFLRDSLKCFAQNEPKLFDRNIYLFCFKGFKKKPKQQKYFASGASQRLLALRNHLGHGATLPDDEAKALIQKYHPDLQSLLDKASFISNWPIIYVESRSATDEFHLSSLIDAELTGLLQTIDISGLTNSHLQHLIICNTRNKTWLDLHPLLVYTKCLAEIPDRWNATHTQVLSERRCGQYKILFFNDLKNESKINFLDYWRGHHSRFNSPDTLPDEFTSKYPKPETPSQNKSRRFDDFVEEHTQYFVGREKELEALDRFIKESTKQAFVVLGVPGMGKTALLAKWSNQSHTFRHFIREGDSETVNTQRIFENLTEQLCAYFQISRKRPTHLETYQFRQEFERVLAEAISKSQQTVCIVIDGLDEAVRSLKHSQGNETVETIIDWLPEPGFWPNHARLVISARPEVKDHEVFAAKFGRDKADWLELGKLSDNEIRSILYQVRSKYEVLATPAYIEAVVERSAGSPLYLRMLVEDLTDQKLAYGQVNVLPRGIIAYFERIIQVIEDKARLKDTPDIQISLQTKVETYNQLVTQGFLTPKQAQEQLEKERTALGAKAGLKTIDLLALYCVTKEPITLGEAAIILEAESSDVQRAFENIRTVLVGHGEGRFSPFHISFREFFLNLGDHTSSQFHRYADTITAVRTRLLTYCAQWHEHRSGYVLRHYAEHLMEIDAWEMLHNLVASGEEEQLWAKTRSAKEGSYRGYLTDLDYARRWAESESGWNISRQIHYALIESSIHSLARNLHPKLLVELAKTGQWDFDKVLQNIWQMPPDGWQRSEALSDLAPILPESLIPEALAITKEITNEWAQASCLGKLSGYLPDHLLEETLAIIRQMKIESARSTAINKTATNRNLTEELRLEAIKLARELVESQNRDETLVELSNLLPVDIRNEVYQDILTSTENTEIESARAVSLIMMAENFPDEFKLRIIDLAKQITTAKIRVMVLCALVEHLPRTLRNDAVNEAMIAAYQVKDPEVGGAALSQLVAYLTGDLKDQVIEEVISIAQEINDPAYRSRVLGQLIEFLPEEKKAEVTADVLSTISEIDDEMAKAARLGEIIAFIPTESQERAAEIAREITDHQQKLTALSVMIEYLEVPLRNNVLSEALIISEEINDHWSRIDFLVNMTTLLTNDQTGEILTYGLDTIKKIESKWARASVFHKIAHVSPEKLEVEEWVYCFVLEGKIKEISAHLVDDIKEIVKWGFADIMELALASSWDADLPLIALDIETENAILSAILEHNDEEIRALALCGLIPHLTDESIHHLFQQLLPSIKSEKVRAAAIFGLYDRLPRRSKKAALLLVREMEDQNEKVFLLSRLVRFFPAELNLEATAELLTYLPQVNEEICVDALIELNTP